MGGRNGDIPSSDTMRAPVAAIMALRGHLLVAFEAGCEFWFCQFG